MKYEVSGCVDMATDFRVVVEADTREQAILQTKNSLFHNISVDSYDKELKIECNCLESYNEENWAISCEGGKKEVVVISRKEMEALQNENNKLKQKLEDYERKFTRLKQYFS